ncbi:MAG: 4Fe-4S dicluster domain-containing protein [Dehalococcoidales bacterium]|nr:4Fe-4S dicluster domain-containing protein [Dehalococcoidales bacterium]
MDKTEQVYRDLQRHMDRMPGGFPEVASGLDIKLLKRFFTPEEAEMAAQLSMKPEPLKRIYNRVKDSGISIEELRQMLDRMMHKGVILTWEDGYDETHYSNAEFAMGGIFNFQLNNLTRELLSDYHQYQAERRSQASPGPGGPLPLRTIPVEKSIPVPEKYHVSDYDSVRKLVENARGKISVANCICRLTSQILGEGCQKTDLIEACLMIGPDHARRHVDMGIGRYLTKEEAFKLLDKAQQDGLVLQPENSRAPDTICICCGDCCVLLKMLNNHPRPVEMYVTNFYAEVDGELCNGCGECVAKCQLNAITVDDKARVNLDRCIGCGNCVTLCPQGAVRLKKKEPEKVPPKDKVTVNMNTLARRVGWWNILKIRTKMLLGIKV